MLLLIFFLFGTIIGSFLNVVILRLPRDEGINGRSYCVHCHHILSYADLVPVFSYLALRGRCRYCKHRISARYFIIETITGLLFALTFAVMHPAGVVGWLNFARSIFIIASLVIVFTVDLEHFLILDSVIFPATAILLVFNLALDIVGKNAVAFSVFNSWVVLGLLSGLGIFFFFGTLYYFSNGRAMGFGDVKFGWFLGLAFPYPLVFVNVFLAFLIGAALGIVLILSKKKQLKSPIPFGSILAVSALVCIYFGPQILDWYLHLLNIY